MAVVKKKNLAGDVPAHRVVKVEWNGNCWCVDLKEVGWKPTLEDVLEIQGRFERK